MRIYDLHCDTMTEMYSRKCDFSADTMISEKTVSGYERFTQCFAVFTNDTETHGMDYFRKVSAYSRPFIEKVNNVTPIYTCEGGAVIDGEPDNLYELKDAGIRIFSLVWNGRTPLATGAVTDDKAGLTELGKICINRLDELGIVPDVSHLSEAGFFDICDRANGMIFATHSNSKAICPHPRNLSDGQIKEIVAHKGLIGLNLYPRFLGEKANVGTVIRHADRFLELGAEDCLALGCDLDGIDETPDGIKNAADLYKIYDEMSVCFGKDLTEKIFHINAENKLGK